MKKGEESIFQRLNSLLQRAENIVKIISNRVHLPLPIPLSLHKSHSNDTLSSCAVDTNHRVPTASLPQHEHSCQLKIRGFDPDCHPFCNNSTTSFYYEEAPAVIFCNTIQSGIMEAQGSSTTYMLPAIEDVLSGACEAKERIDAEAALEFPQTSPTDFWILEKELDGWTPFPVEYSWRMRNLIFKLGSFSRKQLQEVVWKGGMFPAKKWDPITKLLHLCILYFWKESIPDDFDGRESFSCPKLVGAMVWLAHQLSTLNGNLQEAFQLSLSLLKEVFLNVARLNLKKFLASGGASMEQEIENLRGRNEYSDLLIGWKPSLEEILTAVKELQRQEEAVDGQTARFRAMEYERLVEEAATRRLERSYKAVPDNDGILVFTNQNEKRRLSQLEMAAAERDFRRRRIRYRTSTNKKDPKLVMRNLIEGHMNALMKASSESQPKAHKLDLHEERGECAQTTLSGDDSDCREHGNMPSHVLSLRMSDGREGEAMTDERNRGDECGHVNDRDMAERKKRTISTAGHDLERRSERRRLDHGYSWKPREEGDDERVSVKDKLDRRDPRLESRRRRSKSIVRARDNESEEESPQDMQRWQSEMTVEKPRSRESIHQSSVSRNHKNRSKN